MSSKTSFSLSINSRSQSNRVKKPSLSFTDATDGDSSSKTKSYVTEFDPAEAPRTAESKTKSIAPIPNQWRPNKKLKNLHNLPQISNGGDSALQFELDPGSNPEATDSSMSYGLNIRQPSASATVVSGEDRFERISDLELKKLREDLERLPEDTGMDEFEDVPVEGFGAALLSGYGWKEGKGIGRNAKEDVKVSEVVKKVGRGGLGFNADLPGSGIDANSKAGENLGNGKVGREKKEDQKKENKFGVGKAVRVVNGREMGVKGKIVEVRSGGDSLVLRTSSNNEMVKVQTKDVTEVGSAEEEKFLRKFKEMLTKEKDVNKDRKDSRKDRTDSRKRGHEEGKRGTERVNWLRNHIRVRVVSEKLKAGKLFLKKGVVVDVVGPGICDISMDKSRELVQGVDQELLETALPRCGGPVIVLYGKHKGVYGSLLERDSEKETAVVRNADTHELLNVTLEQIAEYTGDPDDIGF